MTNRYAEVYVLTRSREVDRTFHYKLPEGRAAREGTRAIVPFGAGDTRYEGYIAGFTETAPVGEDKLKEIIDIPDDFPSLGARMLHLIEWMRDRYFATAADCVRCAVPPAVRARSGMREFAASGSPPELTAEQERAYGFIKKKFDAGDFKPTLIWGVTGSGKTEIYLRLIAEMLGRGKQVIMLVPEISLTPQMIDVFAARFGNLIAVTHSRLAAGNRYSEWNRARTGGASIMIGTRSAVFAPFNELGLIIIDEEHDHSYKSDMSPKYAAKEIAGFFNAFYGTHLVFGSATPSVESYQAASAGDTDLITLTERINKTMPSVTVTDMRRELEDGNLSLFGAGLRAALAENLKRNEQSILFLNRRGHSTFVSCRRCGFVLKCEDCSVNFTYHIHNELLMCHYCGKTARNPANCPVCGSKYIKYFGVGTQKVERELTELFPECRVLRMDFDTTGQKNSHEKILSSFRRHQADILIGTQMIAKGLDIANVTLVGVICADISLNMGDFRCGETTFQLLTQVAGRAGRSHAAGRVFIQSYNPEHYAVAFARDQDYAGFFEHEISLRRQMDYPPFTKLFQITFGGEDERRVIVLIYKLFEIMKYCNKNSRFEMIGPAPEIVRKVRKNYRHRLIVKAVDEIKLKNFALYCVNKLKEHEDTSGVTMILTPNPE